MRRLWVEGHGLLCAQLVLGIVAYRAGHGDGRQDGWHASAVSHVVGNLVATSLGLLAMSQ